jgi:hypothetical protein
VHNDVERLFLNFIGLFYRGFLHTHLFRRNEKTLIEGGRRNLVFKANLKQLFALLWTLISIVISLIVVLSLGYFPYFILSWQTMVMLFFAVFLVMTLPIYLLIALWHIVSEKAESES